MDHHRLQIRPAERGDLGALLDLYRHLDPEDARPTPGQAAAILERFLRYPGSVILLGEVDGRPACSCTLVVIPNLTRGGRPYGLIENVVTDATFRQRGYGRALLDAATDAAWRQDCYKVMLMTGSKTPATLAFYAGAGFEPSKTGFQKRRLPVRKEP
ncbi:GNAT family N-acetyltransferase [Pseudodonghicola flavimaris]|uniref:GNAT family N-acetyltransferase n=1 Tax=Pseudodonghicola flavimaris TaxID=3050036 RepID=A0ABT7EUW1_9RHOB|nr:GNAT family N-acetyltransferase [Pseudodonghicola flavimaris]MDK3016098.1 GNAT family N-acetyltransferase [Pseudodonghicola flavimaris]